MQIKFGTDGWRGVIAREFTFDNLSLVAQATMDYLRQEGLAEHGLVIGYDRRFLSREFAERVAEVACGNGIKVWLGDGYAPTPAVSWGVHELKAGGGVVITASHNPSIYNGFKFKESFGGSARPSTTMRLEELVNSNLQSGRSVQATPLSEAISKGQVKPIDLRQGYIRQITSYVDLKLIKQAAIPVIIDPMYGAGAGLFSQLLPGTVEVHTLDNPGFAGQPPEPTKERLKELALLVKEGPYRVGLALDGDADRIGAVDETGEFFSSHCIFTVLMRHLYEHKGLKGGIAKTVSTTTMVDLLAKKYGLPLFETPIGFKHICELMLEHDILIGGEESGGLGVKGHIPERDGILMGLLLLEAMTMSGKGLRQLLNDIMAEIGHFAYHRLDFPISNLAKERLIIKLKTEKIATIAGRSVAKKNLKDGFKFIFDDGSWLLIRPSGTEPVIRLYSEASDHVTVAQLLKAGQEIAGI